MAEKALGSATGKTEDIGRHLTRSVQEIGEPGMLRTDDPPNEAQQNDYTNHVASPDMQAQEIVFCDIGDGECDDDRPVSDPDKGIPDPNEGGFLVRQQRLPLDGALAEKTDVLLDLEQLGIDPIKTTIGLELHLTKAHAVAFGFKIERLAALPMCLG